MSTTSKIICITCKEKLWVGQRDYIYTGDSNIMKKLNDFLQKHKTIRDYKHELIFADEHYIDALDMYAPEWKDYE